VATKLSEKLQAKERLSYMLLGMTAKARCYRPGTDSNRRTVMASNPLEIMRNRFMSPYREFSQLQNEFDRLLQGFVNTRPTALADMQMAPSCEVSEEGENFIAKFDIPGVRKEDIKIDLDGNQLTVMAERKEEKKSENKKTRFSEISYGSYMRTFALPSTIDDKKVEAKFDNGVLTIMLPKAPSTKAKQIAIH
jgi:HSP20 family protein